MTPDPHTCAQQDSHCDHSAITDKVFATYMQLLLSGDRLGCADHVRSFLSQGIDIRDIYLHLFQKSMYEVGRLWESNAITVSVEHMATAITEYLLTLVYPSLFAGDRLERTAVISCVAGEYHQIGARIVADIFELNGWNAFFLGSNTPAPELLAFIDDRNPDLVGLSLSLYSNLNELLSLVMRIANAFPDLRILVGGQAFHWGGVNTVSKYRQVVYLPSILELETMLKDWP